MNLDLIESPLMNRDVRFKNGMMIGLIDPLNIKLVLVHFGNIFV